MKVSRDAAPLALALAFALCSLGPLNDDLYKEFENKTFHATFLSRTFENDRPGAFSCVSWASLQWLTLGNQDFQRFLELWEQFTAENVWEKLKPPPCGLMMELCCWHSDRSNES